MAYSPHTEADRRRMLAAIGVESVEDLFADIPAAVRASRFELPPPLAEQEVRAELARLAGRNRIAEVSFLGAGAYRHLIPAVVNEVVGRAEFATAYTPYQPEVSQGTLQSIYEFQSLICELTGMEVASASHYDGATATAEAALMACRLTRRHRVAVSRSVSPDVRRVLHTYCSGPGVEDCPPHSGRIRTYKSGCGSPSSPNRMVVLSLASTPGVLAS
jgi:glycine dehydrogenase subunit 1